MAESRVRRRIRTAILDLAQRRGMRKSLCPSEVARALDPADWRTLMPAVRQAATELADEGRIAVEQKGQTVNPHLATGPIRLRLTAPDGTA